MVFFRKALRNVQESARSSLPHGGGLLIFWWSFHGTMVEWHRHRGVFPDFSMVEFFLHHGVFSKGLEERLRIRKELTPPWWRPFDFATEFFQSCGGIPFLGDGRHLRFAACRRPCSSRGKATRSPDFARVKPHAGRPMDANTHKKTCGTNPQVSVSLVVRELSFRLMKV